VDDAAGAELDNAVTELDGTDVDLVSVVDAAGGLPLATGLAQPATVATMTPAASNRTTDRPPARPLLIAPPFLPCKTTRADKA